MVYRRPKRTRTVTLLPHTYCASLASSCVRVFVDKEHPHPDPLKKLTWGWTKDGLMAGDYNRFYERSGKPVVLEYDITDAMTSNEELKRRGDAIKKFLRGE